MGRKVFVGQLEVRRDGKPMECEMLGARSRHRCFEQSLSDPQAYVLRYTSQDHDHLITD